MTDSAGRPASDRERLGLRGTVREITESTGGWSGPTLAFDREGKLVQPDQMVRRQVVRGQMGPDGVIEEVEEISSATDPERGAFWPAPGEGGVRLKTYGAQYAVTAISRCGQPISTKFTSRAGATLALSEYRYDEGGRLVEIVTFCGEATPADVARIAAALREASRQPGVAVSGEAAEPAERFDIAGSELSRISLRYDGAGRVIGRVHIAFGRLFDRVVYEYNARGDIVREQFDNDPECRVEYEYDSQGNWTRRVTRGQDWCGETSRRITYYD